MDVSGLNTRWQLDTEAKYPADKDSIPRWGEGIECIWKLKTESSEEDVP